MTNLAPAQLANDIQSASYNNACDIPVGDRAPTQAEWNKLAVRAIAANKGQVFVLSETIEKFWGITVVK